MSSAAVSDAQLIARVLVHDDRHAFGELVRRYQSTVRACLRKLTAGNHALADDLHALGVDGDGQARRGCREMAHIDAHADAALAGIEMPRQEFRADPLH